MRRCPACWRTTQGVVCWRTVCRDGWERALRDADRRTEALPKRKAYDPTYEFSRRSDIKRNSCKRCGKPAWRKYCSTVCLRTAALARRAAAARAKSGYQPWRPGKPGKQPKYYTEHMEAQA